MENEDEKEKPETLKETPIVEEKKTIEVNKDQLEKLIGKVDKLEKDNKALLYAADKGRMLHWEQIQGVPRNNSATVAVYNGQIVKSWDSMVKNKYEKTANGAWVEEQICRLNLENGESVEIPFIGFVRDTQLLKGEITGITNDSYTGKSFFTLKLEDGKTITIDGTFLNQKQ